MTESVALPPNHAAGVVLAEYRAYTVDRDGHFIGFEPLACGSDAEAVEITRRLVKENSVELWSGARLVIRLEAPS
jgi:hypothetical protein